MFANLPCRRCWRTRESHRTDPDPCPRFSMVWWLR